MSSYFQEEKNKKDVFLNCQVKTKLHLKHQRVRERKIKLAQSTDDDGCHAHGLKNENIGHLSFF